MKILLIIVVLFAGCPLLVGCQMTPARAGIEGAVIVPTAPCAAPEIAPISLESIKFTINDGNICMTANEYTKSAANLQKLKKYLRESVATSKYYRECIADYNKEIKAGAQ